MFSFEVDPGIADVLAATIAANRFEHVHLASNTQTGGRDVSIEPQREAR